MDQRSEVRRDLAGRMGAWFFVGLGGIFLAAAAVLSAIPTLWAWPVGLLGVALLLFALFASAETRTSALEAILAFFYFGSWLS